MKFHYKKYEGGIKRPVIPIEVCYQNKIIGYEVLVDSGADMSIFDAEIGELLGLKIKEGVKNIVQGITGNEQPYYIHSVTLKVGGWPIKSTVGFMPHMHGGTYGVVGQYGFFNYFVVKFTQSLDEIDIKARFIS